jgi:hypothetical protein
MLSLITTSDTNMTKDALTVAARRRIVQQGFLDHFLNRASTVGYSIVDDSAAIDVEGLNLQDIFSPYSEQS